MADLPIRGLSVGGVVGYRFLMCDGARRIMGLQAPKGATDEGIKMLQTAESS